MGKRPLARSFTLRHRAPCNFVEGPKAPSRLVFATLELLVPGRPLPASGPLQFRNVGIGSTGRVFFRKVAMEAADAVNWYVAAARGNLATPVPADPAQRDPRHDGRPVGASR